MVGERLQELYDFLNKKGLVKNKRNFCDVLGIDYGSLSKYLTNKVNLSVNNLNFQNYKKLGINLEWLLTGEGEMFRNEQTQELAVQKAVRIPLLRQSVSCGPGIDWTNADNIEGYIEPITVITRGLKHLYALHASGTSMVGAGINDGDLLFFNADEHQPISDDIYIFAFAGDVYCKFLRFDKLGMRVKIFSVEKRSLEEMELIKIVPAEDPEFHLFGRVICWVRENRIMHHRR